MAGRDNPWNNGRSGVSVQGVPDQRKRFNRWNDRRARQPDQSAVPA